jgi:hypothetical protein
MRKRMVLATLLAVGVVGQMGLRANTVLSAFLPSTGVVNGAVGSTAGWGFDLRWTSSTDWLSATNSPLSGVLGSDSLSYWPQKLDGVPQGIGSYQFDPVVALGADDMGSIQVNHRKFDSDLSSGSANLLGPDTISASSGFTVSLELASFGLGGLGLALLAWGLRPASRGERLRGRGHERCAVSGYLSQVLVTEFHRGTFVNLKSSVTQPPTFSESSLRGIIHSICGYF